ncbi:MAG: hydrogenase expression/formation protein HypE [Candidatus Solincola sediminis]|uniref:Hydrogenase expression/formation protein HypE n=1 Tax=Candidatus Solincola sediminis TaxID=1797199 RepID=A0A1F2WFB3_9ACTN|nr:MAG: hydrogenase expression/formation protein HypE [Candidatus Solincola sediminis]OFW57787.1 MAG: hydrogenase expression/formation protein HypE [Candidatus Solincola sediminis]
MDDRVIAMAHGGGGSRMLDLLEEIVFPLIDQAGEPEDAAALSLPGTRLAYTTDSFVVKPIFFPGGDIGKLAVCGTANDLAMRGARPLYLTLALILEEGLSFGVLQKVLESAAFWAKEAGVKIVAGDTKVVERGAADSLYINTSGIGVIPEGREVSIKGAEPGDVLIVNGFIGDHETSVLSEREGFDFEVAVDSDCAPLYGLVERMQQAGTIHALRDATRGGLAAVLREMAQGSGIAIELSEESIPVREGVRGVCEMLGLDPMLLANEGKFVAAVPEDNAGPMLAAMRFHPLGQDAAVIGKVLEGRKGEVSILTPLGSHRVVRMPSGENFPRIC